MPFTVTGTYVLNQQTWVDNLVYEDNGGAQVAIPSSAVTLQPSSFSFTNPGLAVGTHTVTVKDPLTGVTATSNSFLVVAAQTITINPITGAIAGTAFTFSGTLTGFSTAPALTYALNGGTPQAVTGVTSTGWSMQVTIPTAGSYTVQVIDGAVSSSVYTFTVSPTSVNHVISPANPGNVSVNSAFTFTGMLSGYTTVPSLSYYYNKGTPVSMTGVSLTSWSMQITAPNSVGSYSLSVTDGTTVGTTTLTVVAQPMVVTPLAPSNAVDGTAFTFTGNLSGYTTIPALQYTVNGGSPVTMTGVSVTGWAMSVTINTSGSTTMVVTDTTNNVSGSATFNVSPASTSLRQWYNNPGQDGSFWVQPFYNTAAWITSGSLVTALRNGSNASPTGVVNLPGNFAAPFYRGKSTDPQVTVTNGTHSIVVHVPLGAVVETPNSASDNSIGGLDETQPYLVWSISGASINGSGAVAATGSVITGTYGFCVMDGSGLMMVDAVTGNAGNANSFGLITGYDLAQLSTNPAYVMQHMLAYSLDPNSQCSGAGPIWPLAVVDTSGANSGPIPQGCTIGIPASVARPTGQTRGFYAWWDCLQQYGGFFYNVAASGATTFAIYDETGMYGSLVSDMQAQISAVMAYVCILNYASGTTGSQYSLATTKGYASGAVGAFPSPPLLDLSPTGGVNVAPSTFGAWYPSGYNATPTNSTTAPMYVITPNAPSGVVIGTTFAFTGTLSGYTTAPALTYAVNGGTPIAMTGVTATGWSMSITVSVAGTDTVVVNDATHAVMGSCSFLVTTSAPTLTPDTWNPNDYSGSIALSNGNYTATAGGSTTVGASPQGVRAMLPVPTSGVVLWEIVASTINQDYATGVANASFLLTSGGGLGFDTNGIGFYPSTGTGSQPAQTVYLNNNQLTSGNGVATVAGGVVTVATNGSNIFFSTAAMRSTSGVVWNNSTTADPVKNVGGFSFSSVGTVYYPTFTTLEGGATAVLMDGTTSLSTFAQSYISANPSVLTLAGATVVAAKTITPNVPTGVVEGAPFTFTGSLTGYTTAPNLVYSLNSAAYQPLSGVTTTGWSTTLTTNVAANNIAVTDGTVVGTIQFSTTAPSTPMITGVTFVPAASIVAYSLVGTVAGTLQPASSGGSLTGIAMYTSQQPQFGISNGNQLVFEEANVTAGNYTIVVQVQATNASNSPQNYYISVPVTSSTASGAFQISNGQVLAPNGQAWTGRGVAIQDTTLPSWVTNAQCQPLTTLFPGINMVRMASYSYYGANTYAQQVGWLTAMNIVVVYEDHQSSDGSDSGGGAGNVFTGSQLTNELNWYSALASANSGNTYVWFGTTNEPSTNPSVQALWQWQQSIYNAIRNTGSSAIIEIEQPDPFQQGANAGLSNTIFSQMHNIVFGPHYYSWVWNGQTNATSQATIYSSAVGSSNSQYGGIVQQVANLQTLTSLDGTVPCGCFEFGPSTDGQTLDNAGYNLVNAVFQAVNSGLVFCSLAWWLQADGSPDALIKSQTSLTTPYGTSVASQILNQTGSA